MKSSNSPVSFFRCLRCLVCIFAVYKCKNFFLISNFCHGLNVVCCLLGNSPASEFYMPTFRNTLFHLHRRLGTKSDSIESFFVPTRL
jgi:hypothetical protein